MLEVKTKILISSVRKLYRRSAWNNIRRILKKTHEADIAALLQELDKAERIKVFSLVEKDEEKASILSYLDSKVQKDLLFALGTKNVQKIINEMDSDDAADLLGNLPKDVSQEILSKMHKESSEDVADLLRYPEDTAGGLMSTDFLDLNQNISVEEAIRTIQQKAEDNVITFYIYVTDESGHLVGVLSLKELILTKPQKLIKEVMTTDVIRVELTTDQEDVAKVVERYDFLSIPVVDEDHKLEGIITVDDVIDVIRAESEDDLMAMGRIGGSREDMSFFQKFWSRIPWLSLSFIAGVFTFFLVRFLVRDPGNVLVDKMASLPLLLSLGATSGGQAATLTVAAANSGKLDNAFFKHIFEEVLRGLIYSFLVLFFVYLLMTSVFHLGSLALPLSLVAALQVFLAVNLGALIPASISKLGYDPTVASIPLTAMIADVTAILLLFLLAT